jgi:hypothetical protein
VRPDDGACTADGRRSGTRWFKVICDGCLVLHRDGEIAYCSEELDGRSCAGYDLPHLAGLMACRITPRGSRCRHCDDVMRLRLMMAPDFVPGGLTTVN